MEGAIVVAFTHRTFAIGRRGAMPWPRIREDMRRFRAITHGGTLVMGRKTYESLGEKALPGRSMVVLGLTGLGLHGPNGNNSDVIADEVDMDRTSSYYYVGGEIVYAHAVDIVDTIYATILEKEYEGCDRFFPVDRLKEFEIASYGDRAYSDAAECHYRFVTYKRRHPAPLPASMSPMARVIEHCVRINAAATARTAAASPPPPAACDSNAAGADDADDPTPFVHHDSQYHALMHDVMQTGDDRPDRTGTGTRAVFGRHMAFDLSRGTVPFLTTKRLAWKSVLRELLWMLRGETDSKILEAQGVNIWRGNTTREFLDARGLWDYPEGETGPLYGAAFRRFRDGEVDQFERVIAGLKNDPYSRRHLMTTFDPSVVDRCVLMPCHGIAIQFYVAPGTTPKQKQKLSCAVYCRSSDVFLGLPFNIASYAMLTHIVAARIGASPHKLVVSTGDTHIYLNHMDQVARQLDRDPMPSPVFRVRCGPDVRVEDMDVDRDFEVVAYLHHPAIEAPMAV
jgi:thymidylate synthase